MRKPDLEEMRVRMNHRTFLSLMKIMVPGRTAVNMSMKMLKVLKMTKKDTITKWQNKIILSRNRQMRYQEIKSMEKQV